MIRGSRERSASVAPCGNANVASTTTSGRAPPGSTPILARTLVGGRATPSTSTVSDAMASCVISARKASSACDFGPLAARVRIASVSPPVAGR